MSEKSSMFTISILKNVIDVYFDTFFVLYFFTVANYEVLPLAKYYLTFYLVQGFSFFLIRNAMKRNIKVPYFRIGISLQAIFIALIMVLKEHIIDYVLLVGVVRGIAGGFFHFPRNILSSEKIDNGDRQKYEGMMNVINRSVGILIPLGLGIFLSHFTYVQIGKIIFLLFIVMFIVSFWIKDREFKDQKFDFGSFRKLIRENKDVRWALIIPFLSGFTYSSGVMGTIVTLSKINNFKTNLTLGYVDSLCAFLGLVAAFLFASKIKKKSFQTISYVTGVLFFIILFVFSFNPVMIVLIVYLLIRNSLVKFFELIDDNVTVNLSNCEEIKTTYKAEFYCIRDIVFSISRSIGQVVLLLVCLFWGMENISYILILSAFAILIEGIILGKLSTSY